MAPGEFQCTAMLRGGWIMVRVTVTIKIHRKRSRKESLAAGQGEKGSARW